MRRAFARDLIARRGVPDAVTDVAVDGKTLRRSLDRAASKAAIHRVSAWAKTHRLVLGQLKVEDKSNEITAIPQL